MPDPAVAVQIEAPKRGPRLLQRLRQAVLRAQEQNPALSDAELIDMAFSADKASDQVTLYFRKPR